MSHFARYLLIVTIVLVIAVIAVAYRSTHALHKKTSTSPIFTPTKSSDTSHKTTSTVSVHPVRSTESRIVIHETDAQSIVHMTEGTQFIVSLGSDLSWHLVFSPANLVTPVLGTSVRTGIQGVYVATEVGTTILTATGAPICTPGTPCPQFREHFSVQLDIQSATL